MSKLNRNSVMAMALVVAAGLLLQPVAAIGQQPETKGGAAAAAAGEKAQPVASNQPAQPAATPPGVGVQMPPAAPPVAPQMPIKAAGAVAPQPTVVLQPGEAPQIEFDTAVYDFGKIRAGIEVVHDFWFTNTGTGPLEILAVRPSCGCTQAGAYDHIVQPGQSGKIPLKMNPGNVTAPVQKSITIMTNATGAGANIALTLKGEVWQIVQVTPPHLNFGKILKTEAATAAPSLTAAITVNNGAMAKMGEIKSSNPAFKAEINEVEPGVKYNLVVTVVPPLKDPNNYSNIEIMTGLAEMPKVNVTASAQVEPEVMVTPSQVAFTPTSKVAQKRPISVRNNGKTPMALTNAVCSNPGVTVTVQEVQPGMMWQLMVDLPADYAKAGAEPDKITFNTDKAGFETVTLPIIEQQMAMPMNRPGMTVNPGATISKTPVPAAPGQGVGPALGTGATNSVPPAQPAAVDPHAGHGH